MSLVKPQFEAGRENVGKKGIVRDPKVHLDVLEETAKVANNAGFIVKDASFSPITGGEGNIEFIFHLVSPKEGQEIESFTNFKEVVQTAHEQLK